MAFSEPQIPKVIPHLAPYLRIIAKVKLIKKKGQMSSLTRFTCFSNILSTYIKIREKKNSPYRDKAGDQQQVEEKKIFVP